MTKSHGRQHRLAISRANLVALAAISLPLSVLIVLLSGWIIAAIHGVPEPLNQMRDPTMTFDRKGWEAFHWEGGATVDAIGYTTDIWRGFRMSKEGGMRNPIDTVAEVRFGFPFRSHQYLVMRDTTGQQVVQPGTAFTVRGCVLPMTGSLFGFAGNTVIAYSILMGALIAVRSIARQLRIRRGVCPNCCYRLLGLGADRHRCPECGAPLLSRDNGCVDE